MGWFHQYGNFTDILSPRSIVAGRSGEVYISGSNLSSSGASQQTEDVVRLDASTGTQVWSRNFQSSPAKLYLLTSLTIGTNGNPVVAGAVSIANSVIVGFGSDPSAHSYISELDASNGQSLWTSEPSTGLGDQITSLTTVGGKLYAAGSTDGTFADAYKAQVEGDFLMRVGGSGNIDWVQQFGRGPIINSDTPSGLQVTTDGNSIYVAGPTQNASSGSIGLVLVLLSAWGK